MDLFLAVYRRGPAARRGEVERCIETFAFQPPSHLKGKSCPHAVPEEHGRLVAQAQELLGDSIRQYVDVPDTQLVATVLPARILQCDHIGGWREPLGNGMEVARRSTRMREADSGLLT